MTPTDEVFAELGREIVAQLGPSMDEEVGTAVEKLEDDNIVAFSVVALRETDNGVQSGWQRAIDPERVRESDRDPEEVVEAIHDAMCRVFDEEVRER